MSAVENKSDNKQTYTPSVWRLLLVLCVLPVTATFLGWLSMYSLNILNGRVEKWLDVSGLLINAVIASAFWSLLLIGFNRDWFAIEIDDSSISGQAIFGGRRMLLLNELDVEKTKQRTILDKLCKEWTIWDKKKNKIVINGWLFPDDQITEILRILGFDNQS